MRALADHEAAFAVVGGAAVGLQGSARTTLDLDVCYERSKENVARVAAALRPLCPRLRGAPEGLPFHLDADTLERGLNFTLETDAGAIDLLGEITGIGGYAAVLALCDTLPAYGLRLQVLSLDGLERAKLATGRFKDLLDVAEIRAVRDQRCGKV